MGGPKPRGSVEMKDQRCHASLGGLVAVRQQQTSGDRLSSRTLCRDLETTSWVGDPGC